MPLYKFGERTFEKFVMGWRMIGSAHGQGEASGPWMLSGNLCHDALGRIGDYPHNKFSERTFGKFVRGEPSPEIAAVYTFLVENVLPDDVSLPWRTKSESDAPKCPGDKVTMTS